MIIIEFVCYVAKSIAYWVSRFFIWIITTRDCRHCKYGHFVFSFPHWQCWRQLYFQIECKKRPWRTRFERRSNEHIN